MEFIGLISATIGAIIIFVAFYLYTVRSYIVLLKQVSSLIDGNLKKGFFYHSIKLRGKYKGRAVVSGIEQLKEGGAAFFIKVKLGNPINFDSSNKSFTREFSLRDGWVTPRFYISKSCFNYKIFERVLDQLTNICDKIDEGNYEEVKKASVKNITVKYYRDYKTGKTVE